MDNVMQLSAQGKIPLQRFHEYFQPIENHLSELEEEIPRLQSEIDFYKINLSASDQILAEANDLYQGWPTLNFDEKRIIIETITEKIVIDSDQVTIDLCHVPTSFKNMTDGKHTQSPATSGNLLKATLRLLR